MLKELLKNGNENDLLGFDKVSFLDKRTGPIEKLNNITGVIERIYEKIENGIKYTLLLTKDGNHDVRERNVIKAVFNGKYFSKNLFTSKNCNFEVLKKWYNEKNT